MRFLVTGAGGFSGSHVVRKLAADGEEVYAVLRGAAEDSRIADCLNRVHVLRLDLNDFHQVRSVLGKLDLDCAIHLAWYAVPGKYWTAPENLEGVASSLYLARALAQANCRRFVGIGSCAEYDWKGGGVLSETATPCRPSTLYGVAKNSLRQILEKFFQDTPASFSWLRFFYLYGPGERRERLVPETILTLLSGKRMVCRSGGLVRDFLDVRDAASAVCAAAKSGVKGAVNIGSGRGVEIRRVVETIAGQLKGFGGSVFYEPDAAPEPPALIADTRRLNGEIGWKPSVNLEKGIRDAISYWRR